MPRLNLDLTGRKFGFLTVLEKLPNKNLSGQTQWKCQCSCGNIKITFTARLLATSRQLTTCGKCQWHLKHKEAYVSFMAMKQRCLDPAYKDYPGYGGRGIGISTDWHHFQNFIADMGDPPLDPVTKERLSLDRIDVNGNYCKDNCRWATRSEQQLNKRKEG